MTTLKIFDAPNRDEIEQLEALVESFDHKHMHMLTLLREKKKSARERGAAKKNLACARTNLTVHIDECKCDTVKCTVENYGVLVDG